MLSPRFLTKTLVGGLLAAVLVGGDALAQRGEGRGRGGGGGGGGGQRSFSGGSSNRGSSSRSMSRAPSQSSRSSISSPRSSGSSQMRSSGESSRSSRSVNPGSGSSRQFSRPSGGQSSREFGGSPQSIQRTPNTTQRTPDSGRTFRSAQPSGGTSRVDGARSGRPSGESSNPRFGSGSTPRTVDGRGRGPTDGQRYESRRPNNEQVRDFLQMRDRDGRGEARQGERSAISRDRDGQGLRPGRRPESVDRTDVARRLEGVERDGRGNRDFNRDRDFGREGREGDRLRDRGRDGNRQAGDRNREYQRWRDGISERHRNFDDRDWSGRWRDGDRFDYARRIRNDWRGRDRGNYPFYAGWWTGQNRWHGGYGNRWNWWGNYALRYNRPYYWWAWTTAPVLTNWVSFGWNRPYYWDYGPGEYIYTSNGVVYVNGRWYQPLPVYYNRTVQIVERAPDLTPEAAAELEWLPLGVFAVTLDGEAKADVLVQLAVTKDGVISGTAFDQRSGAASPVEGMVDKQTQRAVWSFNNEQQKRVVMETSIYNLTQAEATGLVHYGPEDSRVVELVRLEDPSNTTGTTGAAATTTGELPAP